MYQGGQEAYLRKVVFDIEADGLQPTKIWIIVCRDLDTRETVTFFPYRGVEETQSFIDFSKTVDQWVGHYALRYDVLVINRLIPAAKITQQTTLDTFVIGKLVEFNRKGHSLEDYGEDFGVLKVIQNKWDEWDDNFIPRCTVDVDITERVYQRYLRYLSSATWKPAIDLEHYVDILCQDISKNGFAFDIEASKKLYIIISKELSILTKRLQDIFPKKTILVKEVVPKATKFGTIHRGAFKFLGTNPDLSAYQVNCPFSVFEWQEFNPGSTKQRIDRLWEAGWQPEEKSDGHKDFLKSRGRYGKLDPERKAYFDKYGWKTNEVNLRTLPDNAPDGIKTLVRWILLRSRVSRLDEWHAAYNEVTGRIHGQFQGIGAWTGRMAHSKPNMGNIPKFNDKRPETTPYSDVMRGLWVAPRDRYLVGVDAEGIQLRVLAHYINDKEFTHAVVGGRKEDASDPHSVNQRALGAPCKSRDDAKTFIYAWLLGAGVGKVADILKCSKAEAEIACKNFLDRFENLLYLKTKVIPKDAAFGYFQGFDGRYVPIYGDDQGAREHFALAGYLQNGEAIVMKRATKIWKPRLELENIPFKLVNLVHDEWQIEVPRDLELAKYVAGVVADSLRVVGDDLKLRCPFAGSILNGHGKIAIGQNWLETH